MGTRTEVKAIHPHKIVPMRALSDGRLVSASDEVIPSVADSRARYQEITDDLANGGYEGNPPLEALVRRWKEIIFDEVCGHWICTWTPHVVAEYCYLSLVMGKKRVNLGSHVAAYLGINGEIPTYVAGNGKSRRMAVDHLCLVKLCCNPAHLAIKSVAENTRSSRHAYKQVALAAQGQGSLFDPHLDG